MMNEIEEISNYEMDQYDFEDIDEGEGEGDTLE